MKPNCLRNILYLGVFLVIALIIYSLVSPVNKAQIKEVPISEISQQVGEGKVS